ncbi:MAG: hypothetical protein WCH39_21205 [Schlesneria sp.]
MTTKRALFVFRVEYKCRIITIIRDFALNSWFSAHNTSSMFGGRA